MGVGVFTIPQNLKQNNAVLLFTDLLAPKIRSKLFSFVLSDRALNGGFGLKDRQNVLPQPISPAFFDASLTSSVFSRDLKY